MKLFNESFTAALKASECPSGDHVGSPGARKSGAVISGRTLLPSALTTQMPAGIRSVVKAIVDPSGDHAGAPSEKSPDVTLVV